MNQNGGPDGYQMGNVHVRVMGLIAVRMRRGWRVLRAGRFGWPALVVRLLAGGMTAMAMERVVPRGPREPSERAHAPGRAATHAAHKLEYALRWLKVWPERAPAPGRRAGPLTERDFPLAAGLAGRFAAQFPGSPIAVQLAIQEAAEGSDREQQVYDTRAFAALCAAPEESIAALGGALDSDEAGANAGTTRLLLAIAHATGRARRGRTRRGRRPGSPRSIGEPSRARRTPVRPGPRRRCWRCMACCGSTRATRRAASGGARRAGGAGRRSAAAGGVATRGRAALRGALPLARGVVLANIVVRTS